MVHEFHKRVPKRRQQLEQWRPIRTINLCEESNLGPRINEKVVNLRADEKCFVLSCHVSGGGLYPPKLNRKIKEQ